MKTAAPSKLVLIAAAWFAAVGSAFAQFGPPQIGPPQSGIWVPARPVGMAESPFAAGQAPAAPTSDRPGDGGLQWPLPASARAHPAVCRIVVPTHDGESWGSGTLVDVTDRYGLVLTNWHVVDEATGEISVIFPDGFRSGGRVLKVDRDWDLAAIAIWRPAAQPAPLATQVPQPGDNLTIAGYGSGQYRTANGRCAQYLSPGDRFPFDMIELTATARQGDSGGPIFNSRGELAGVLFGEGSGRTSGSHIGRVRWFLSSVLPSAAPNSAVQAGRPGVPTRSDAGMPAATPQKPATGGLINSPAANPSANDAARGQIPATTIAQRDPTSQPETPAAKTPWPPVQPAGQSPQPATPWNQRPNVQSPASATPAVAASQPDSGQSTIVTLWHNLAGATPLDRLKSIFAVVGVLALVSRIFRMVRK